MFIYALIDPINSHVMYIGKSKDVARRYRAHVSVAINKRYLGVKGDWIRYLAYFNLRPELQVLNEVPDAQSVDWEFFYIKLFRASPLVNTGVVFKETYQMTIW